MCIEEFPLVQGERERYGNLLQVLLIDVDEPGSGVDGLLGALGEPRADQLLKRMGLDWPNAVIRGGLGATQRTFNRGGYSTILVDQHGIVRGVDLFGDQFTELVERVMGEWAKERLHRDAGTQESDRTRR